ncbi:hypothetical protein EU837_01995 [Salmonella enterica subsp. enterica serovar Kibi]|nr:hypothetical protein [Salmonella enterica subsp. enterica serovar Kibi]
MATKFIYDTKSIMTRAWELARIAQKRLAKRNPNYTVRLCFSCALDNAWAEAKEAMKQAVASEKAKSKPGNRYLELLSIAERDGLNHGKSWCCGDREIETMGMNPMHDGELVCYVYSN